LPTFSKAGVTQFQLLLYGEHAAAMTQTVAKPGLYAAPIGTSGMPVKKHVECVDALGEALEGTLASALSGALAPLPLSPADCANCDARGICRRPQMMVGEEESSEP
jgi:hypothetical protein